MRRSHLLLIVNAWLIFVLVASGLFKILPRHLAWIVTLLSFVGANFAIFLGWNWGLRLRKQRGK